MAHVNLYDEGHSGMPPLEYVECPEEEHPATASHAVDQEQYIVMRHATHDDVRSDMPWSHRECRPGEDPVGQVDEQSLHGQNDQQITDNVNVTLQNTATVIKESVSQTMSGMPVPPKVPSSVCEGGSCVGHTLPVANEEVASSPVSLFKTRDAWEYLYEDKDMPRVMALAVQRVLDEKRLTVGHEYDHMSPRQMQMRRANVEVSRVRNEPVDMVINACDEWPNKDDPDVERARAMMAKVDEAIKIMCDSHDQNKCICKMKTQPCLIKVLDLKGLKRSEYVSECVDRSKVMSPSEQCVSVDVTNIDKCDMEHCSYCYGVSKSPRKAEGTSAAHTNVPSYTQRRTADGDGSQHETMDHVCVAKPLGAHLTLGMKCKIGSRAYVNVFELLRRDEQTNKGSTEEHSQMHSRPEVAVTIENWTSAFLVYASVYSEQHPKQCVSIMSYMELVRSAYNEYGGLGWYWYDVEFRCRMATDEKLEWRHIDSQLWSQCMSVTTHVPMGQTLGESPWSWVGVHRSQSGTRLGTGRKWLPDGACWAYNRGECFWDTCKYMHVCAYCRGKHTVNECTSYKTDRQCSRMVKCWGRGRDGVKHAGTISKTE